MKNFLLLALLSTLFFTNCTKDTDSDLSDLYEGNYLCNGNKVYTNVQLSDETLNQFSMRITKTGSNTVDIIGLVCDTIQASASDKSLVVTSLNNCRGNNFVITKSGDNLNFSYESYEYSNLGVYLTTSISGTAIKN